MKKFARILTAAVAVAGSVMGLAPAAQAAPGNTVLLGDSYFANTTLNRLLTPSSETLVVASRASSA